MITQPVGDVVRSKDIQELVTVPHAASVAEAVALMTRKGVGAVIIASRPGVVEGIFTGEGRDPKSTPVSSVMSPEVRRVDAAVSVEDTLRLMVVHGHRHLVVEDGGAVLGLVSIRDLMHWIILPDTSIAYEGRVGVIRARTAEALQEMQEHARR